MGEKNDVMESTGKSSPNVAVVRAFYDALARGDVPAILDLLHPEVEWRAPESVPWGGTFHGREGFQQFIGKLLGQPAELRREVRDYLDAGERVVVLLRQMGRRKGGQTEYDVPEAQIWTVRHGRVVDFEGYFDTSIVLRALQLQRRA